jgi:hypothetical protein
MNKTVTVITATISFCSWNRRSGLWAVEPGVIEAQGTLQKELLWLAAETRIRCDT